MRNANPIPVDQNRFVGRTDRGDPKSRKITGGESSAGVDPDGDGVGEDVHGSELCLSADQTCQGAALDSQPPKEIRYNPNFPIEYYDFIVVDECHRSIYNLWRGVLEYFDAFLIGLTATPSKQTFGFFNQNLVMEYSRQRAVADGVNVDGEVYRIRTQITE